MAAQAQNPHTSAPLASPPTTPTLLLYTRTDVPHHPSIHPGVQALTKLAAGNGFILTHTEDPSVFCGPSPAQPNVIVLLNTATDELDDVQREGLVRRIREGSAFVGIHSASYFQKDWPWYEGLVGARFAGHPEPQMGRIEVVDANHPATRGIAGAWEHLDEWYNFRAIPSGVRVLATVDESSYAGGAHPAHHPVMWCHTYEGSRSFYTALGHTEECFSDPRYLKHILGALRWAAGLAD